MTRQYTTGNASISFETPVFIQSCASIVSQKEGEGPLGSCFDSVSSEIRSSGLTPGKLPKVPCKKKLLPLP